jgi:hypothetical protein
MLEEAVAVGEVLPILGLLPAALAVAGMPLAQQQVKLVGCLVMLYGAVQPHVVIWAQEEPLLWLAMSQEPPNGVVALEAAWWQQTISEAVVVALYMAELAEVLAVDLPLFLETAETAE